MYTLLKVVGYYDLNVLPISVMVFQKSLDVSSIQFFWDFLNFAKPLPRESPTTFNFHGSCGVFQSVEK